MSQEEHPAISVNERLGYSKEDKLLLINADDAGMCQAVNAGIERAFSVGLVTSCTLMVPCPWFEDFVARALRNPHIRVGVHLTTTSEWEHYRWGPVSPRSRVPSLLDDKGYLHRSAETYYRQADLQEIEIEFRAQIDKCLAAGIRPTHLDSHMGTYHFKDETFAIAKRLAEEYNLVLRVGHPERVLELQSNSWCIPDRLFWDTHDVPLEARRNFYTQVLKNLEPGLTELVLHPAEPTEELRAIGGMWQRRGFDLEFFTNGETRELLAECGIILIGYERLQAATGEFLGWH